MATVARWSGREARALREARRLSVRAFAAHLGVAKGSVINWERRGERARLRHETQEILDRDLSLADDETRRRFSATLTVTPLWGTQTCLLPSTIETGPGETVPVQRRAPGRDEPASHEPDERRRALLRGIAGVAAGFGLLVGPTWPMMLRVGRSDITRLKAVTALYRSLDYEFGGGMLVADVGRFAESASALLELSYSDALAPSLLSAVAGARQLAGWTAFDAGLHSDAQRHFLSAERAAVAADDRPLAARIRYCQARQFQHLRHNRDALDTLRLAQDYLGNAATPAVTAMLYGAEAASLAALGDQQPALTSLGKARDGFDRITVDWEPEWMAFYDQGELLAQYGRVYRDFARADQRRGPAAVHWVTDAIAALGPQNVRSSVLNGVGLCSALFLADEPEQAVTVGNRVLEQAQQLTSRRVLDRIRNLRRDMARHMPHPQVTDFAHALDTLGTGAA